MPICKSSVSVEASPEDLFTFVSDPRNLPLYFTEVTRVEPTGADVVRVTSMVDGHARVSDGWFRVQRGHRDRVEWGSDGQHGYHGWLEVDPEGSVASITVEVHTEHGTDEDVDAALDAALIALKGLIEGG